MSIRILKRIENKSFASEKAWNQNFNIFILLKNRTSWVDCIKSTIPISLCRLSAGKKPNAKDVDTFVNGVKTWIFLAFLHLSSTTTFLSRPLAVKPPIYTAILTEILYWPHCTTPPKWLLQDQYVSPDSRWSLLQGLGYCCMVFKDELLKNVQIILYQSCWWQMSMPSINWLIKKVETENTSKKDKITLLICFITIANIHFEALLHISKWFNRVELKWTSEFKLLNFWRPFYCSLL